MMNYFLLGSPLNLSQFYIVFIVIVNIWMEATNSSTLLRVTTDVNWEHLSFFLRLECVPANTGLKKKQQLYFRVN